MKILYQKFLNASQSTGVRAQYLWGVRPGHRDELILRDRDTDGNGTLDERLYCLMDYYNPTAVLNSAGEVRERYAWSAFGLRRVMEADWTARSSSAYGFDFGFHGQFLDGETGYYDYGYRYYSAEIGRWLSRDPVAERGGTNLYAGMSNRAVNSNDFRGMFLERGLEDPPDVKLYKDISFERKSDPPITVPSKPPAACCIGGANINAEATFLGYDIINARRWIPNGTGGGDWLPWIGLYSFISFNIWTEDGSSPCSNFKIVQYAQTLAPGSANAMGQNGPAAIPISEEDHPSRFNRTSTSDPYSRIDTYAGYQELNGPYYPLTFGSIGALDFPGALKADLKTGLRLTTCVTGMCRSSDSSEGVKERHIFCASWGYYSVGGSVYISEIAPSGSCGKPSIAYAAISQWNDIHPAAKIEIL
ncbi:MAG: hypothetical protein H7A52_08510 [Akkermansiaceae bacterium]|nr:hypothetical protein [Akkermansiaceae bacterium]